MQSQRDVLKKYHFHINAMPPQAPIKKFLFYLYRSYLLVPFYCFENKTPEANGSYLLCKLAESSSRHQLENIPQKGTFPSVCPSYILSVSRYSVSLLPALYAHDSTPWRIMRPAYSGEMRGRNCYGAPPHYPVSRPLMKTNRAADI